MKLNNFSRLSSFINKKIINNVIGLTIGIQIAIVIISLISNLWLGGFILILVILMDLTLLRFTNQLSEELNDYISNLSYRIKRGEQEALIRLPIGVVILNEDKEIEWTSPYLQASSSDNEAMVGQRVTDVFKGIEDILNSDDVSRGIIKWNDEHFMVRLEEDVNVVYLENISSFIELKEETDKNRSVVGWLFLDNYDEVIKGLDDRAISNFNSLITTYLSNWARQHNIYYKRIENDKYLLLFRQEELKRLESEKFNIVTNIREYTSKRNLPLTISIGISYGETSFVELTNYAQKDLDLALGRGGDQAIVREVEQEPRYYGGNTNPMEKRTRVRSRMISEALQEQIKQSPVTYVMGHAYPDMDSVGSALGVARIAMMLGKECKVVIDEEKIGQDISNLLNQVKNYNDSARNIITPKEAFEEITEDDLVVMVDHHKPSMSIAPKLYEKNQKIVIIDHHRRGDEFPTKPILVYIEPYASSASELITELFEYVSTDSDSINRIEATAMLGGIIVDTNNFSLRTGSRTFDAASYLQSVGADTTMIQRILKEHPDNYLRRMELVKTLEFVGEGIAVAHGKEDDIHRQVLAAQTADSMLSMTDVEASFVIIRLSPEKIGISARSLGQINVQRIMEKMGGGGHLTNAATQVEDKSIVEVKEMLIEVIKELNT